MRALRVTRPFLAVGYLLAELRSVGLRRVIARFARLSLIACVIAFLVPTVSDLAGHAGFVYGKYRTDDLATRVFGRSVADRESPGALRLRTVESFGVRDTSGRSARFLRIRCRRLITALKVETPAVEQNC